MKIFFIRHGQTLANEQKKYLGKSDSPFTHTGSLQNEAYIARLQTHSFDAIYSSPALRCSSQAEILGQIKNIDVVKDDRISEIDFGLFEGLTWRQAKDKYPGEFESFCKNPNEFHFPGGESQAELDIRAAYFIDDMLKSSYENIAVFSHGGAIMSMLSVLLELKPEQKWRFKVTHGAVFTIEIADGYACLILGEL